MSSLTLRQIQAKIEAKRAEAAAMLDAAPDGVLPPEQQAAWDALMAAIDGLKGALGNRAALDDFDRRAAGSPLATTGDPLLDREAGRVSLLDAVRAMLPHEMRGELTREQQSGADRARTVSDEIARRSGRPPKGIYYHAGVSGAAEQRVLSTFGPPGGPGGNLIATTLAPSVQDRLREKLLIRRMGATVMTGMVGNFALPRLTGSAQAQWIAENGSITPTDPAFDQVLFTPKHCGGIVALSRNMLLQPSYDATALIENDLAKVLAVALDKAALVGTGVNDPAGLLLPTSGITILPGAANGAALTWNDVVNLIKAVDQSNALDGKLGFITNAKLAAALKVTPKVTADTIGNFILQDPNELAGYPLGTSQIMPSNFAQGTGANLSGILFGAFDMMMISFWSEIDLLLNPYDPAAYASGGLLIRAMMTADIHTRQPKAFAAMTSVVAP